MRDNMLTVMLFCLLSLCGYAVELPEQAELFSRRPIGTYRIHATTDAVVSGKGKVDLLICQPYPESNKYQDVKWLKEVPDNLRAIYPETGHPYVRFAERVMAPTTINIDRDYVVTLYEVKFDWSSVRVVYPYDKTADEYIRYTRRYPYDIADTNAYENAYLWVAETSQKIRKDATDDLDYVRRVYSLVTAEFTYGDWSGGFTNLIARKQGDCGGITHAFVSLLREGGIPARSMACLRPNEGPHVWPEFYLQEYGWIPTDPTYDLGRPSNPNNFGARWDDTIVMTYDTGFTVQTAGGITNYNVFVQGLAWWWYWWWENPDETERNVNLKTTWENFPGMLTNEGSFISTEDLWKKLDDYGVKPHVGFVFDGNYQNIGTNEFTLWNGQNCSYVNSPLGYALRLEHDDGPWTEDSLEFGKQWTILTKAKLVGVENVPLFCIGSSWGGNTGFVLASGKTNEVTLSFWQDASEHIDLITAHVPDSTTKYHSYALRANGLDVSLFVDGVCVGEGRFPVFPQAYGLQFHTVYGGICNSGLAHFPGGCVEDWRLYNSFIPDEMIMTYAEIGDRQLSGSEPEPTPEPKPEPEPEPTPEPEPVKPELGNGNYDVVGDELVGTVPETAASVYDGYIYLNNVVMGSIQAKVAKPKKGVGKLTVAIQITGEKKLTLKGELDLAISEFIATDKKSNRTLILKFGSKGITGTFGKYDIDGARNFFNSKDKSEKATAEEILKPYLGAYSMSCDGGILSVTIAKKGKVTIKGAIDGNKVSAKAQALIGEKMICIPVIYSKKSVNLAFTIWISISGGNAEIIGLDGDPIIGKAGKLKDGAKFVIDGDIGAHIPDLVEEIDGYCVLPDGESVSVSGTKWVIADGVKAAKVAYKKGVLIIVEGKNGAGIVNPSGLKLSYKSKDDSFKGSFTVYAIVNGKLKKHKATVEGILIGDVGYGTITIKKVGTWGVTIE